MGDHRDTACPARSSLHGELFPKVVNRMQDEESSVHFRIDHHRWTKTHFDTTKWSEESRTVPILVSRHVQGTTDEYPVTDKPRTHPQAVRARPLFVRAGPREWPGCGAEPAEVARMFRGSYLANGADAPRRTTGSLKLPSRILKRTKSGLRTFVAVASPLIQTGSDARAPSSNGTRAAQRGVSIPWSIRRGLWTGMVA